ncbi:MAG: OmpW family outer membrane protein [Gammaproteobacteria bacterium]|jgi:outer membrane protein
MNQRFTRKLLASLLATAALLATAGVYARQAGDLMVRVGGAGVYPSGESESFPAGGTNDKVEADDAWSLGLTIGYMITDNIGIELLGAFPFEHDIQPEGTLSATLGSGSDIGSIKHLPPTLNLQYHFNTGSKLTPYVGAGVNYTYFFDEDTKGALKGADLDLDDSWGLSGQLGVDYDLENDWLLNASVWYVDIDTKAKVTGIPSFDVEIDPWVFMVGVGKKF